MLRLKGSKRNSTHQHRDIILASCVGRSVCWRDEDKIFCLGGAVAAPCLQCALPRLRGFDWFDEREGVPRIQPDVLNHQSQLPIYFLSIYLISVIINDI